MRQGRSHGSAGGSFMVRERHPHQNWHRQAPPARWSRPAGLGAAPSRRRSCSGHAGNTQPRMASGRLRAAPSGSASGRNAGRGEIGSSASPGAETTATGQACMIAPNRAAVEATAKSAPMIQTKCTPGKRALRMDDVQCTARQAGSRRRRRPSSTRALPGAGLRSSRPASHGSASVDSAAIPARSPDRAPVFKGRLGDGRAAMAGLNERRTGRPACRSRWKPSRRREPRLATSERSRTEAPGHQVLGQREARIV